MSDMIIDHEFWPVLGHPDDDECTHRSDGTDATYCGQPEYAHESGDADSWREAARAALTAAIGDDDE